MSSYLKTPDITIIIGMIAYNVLMLHTGLNVKVRIIKIIGNM